MFYERNTAFSEDFTIKLKNLIVKLKIFFILNLFIW